MTAGAIGGSAKAIAIFIPSLRGGGAERVMLTLAGSIAAYGHKVDLVLCEAAGEYVDDVPANVCIVDLGAPRVASALIPLVRYLRHERPDVLLSAISHANVVAILAAKLSRLPLRIVISEHNMFPAARTGDRLRGARVVPLLMRLTYKWADTVVAVSQGVAEALQSRTGLSGRRVSVVYNPVDVGTIVRKSQEDAAHAMVSDDERPLFLAAGRLIPLKDFPTLLRAFALLVAQRPARLVILGQGELRSELEAMVRTLGLEGKVEMPGFVANPFAWMRRADVFVLSSVSEGFANVLLEAMVCGARIVSTDCASGPRELLEDGKWGRLVPVGDATAMAEAMAGALDDRSPPDVRHRAADFSVARATDGYLSALRISPA